MSINKYISRDLGRCLTEYKLENFDEVKSKCTLFFRVSQFRDLSGVDLLKLEQLNYPLSNEMPKCGYGEKIYGVLPDRSTIKLIEIIDSSD